MKYKDSLQQALEKAGLVKAFLQQNQLAIHPINYAVAYDYISGNNAELCQAIEQKLASKAVFDDFIMAELYQRWLADENAEQEQALSADYRVILIWPRKLPASLFSNSNSN